MYEEFYGFTDKPFQIVPNPEYLYLSPKHENALTYIEYGISEKVGFILLTGEIGSGKTTLIRYLLNQIESTFEVAVIFNTNVSAQQLIKLILQEFELESPAGNKPESLEVLYQFLIDKYAEKKTVLLIIDEAQNLTKEALEEIRMLSNLQSDEQLLMQIMLVGQPELKARLKDPSLVQFSQRIAVNYHLEALTKEETRKYINFRLKKAGGEKTIFTPDAVNRIYTASGGVPRKINVLCDSALVYGFADELGTIDASTIEKVIEELGLADLYFKSTQNRFAVSKVNERTKSDGFLQRLQDLESNLQQLQFKVETQIEELESKAEGYKDEMIGNLKELLLMERKRSDKLLTENSKLRMKLKAIQRTDQKNKL